MIRVLVVDDSAVVRNLLAAELQREPDIEVIGHAADPFEARDLIVRLAPDVLTLDVEMPHMDGLSFLERLMKHHPLPVVVFSSATGHDSDAAVHALSLGAVEVIPKPGPAVRIPSVSRQLVAAIRAAARAHVQPRESASAAEVPTRALRRGKPPARPLLAVGASTGGPAAIERLLAAMPAGAPPILIVQHMPVGFTAAFARRLDDRCALRVREAADGALVEEGVALIAPGGRHMVLLGEGDRLRVGVRAGPPVHFQRPAVDVLFHSIAGVAGASTIGILLTGMGADGATGMRALRDAGAHTIAQDEKTCVVFSMPAEAIRLGGACDVLPLPRIAAAALAAAGRTRPEIVTA